MSEKDLTRWLLYPIRLWIWRAVRDAMRKGGLFG